MIETLISPKLDNKLHLKDAIMNQCIRLVESLVEFSKTRPVNEVKQAMVGVVSVLGNIRMVEENWELT